MEIPADKKLNFLDEDGNPVVISSALPNNIKIYIQIKKTFTEQFIEQNNLKNDNINNSIDWCWNEEIGEKTYERKNNNKTVTHTSDRRSSYCKGNLIMNTGEYYYTILFEPLQCCIFASICPSDLTFQYSEMEKIDWLDFWNLWPEYPDPHHNFPGPVIEAGFYVNIDLKLLIIYDNKKKKEIKRVNFNQNWNSISPIIQFKHNVSITISSNALKGKPSFLNI